MNERIVLVFGKICSGKGHFCKQFSLRTHIITSSIVKQLSQFDTRSQLGTTKHLDQEIAEEIIKQINEVEGNVIIDGIRQLSIVQAIVDCFGQTNVALVWLDVSKEELKRRFLSRKDIKDDQDFETALLKDAELGLDELEQEVRANPSTYIVRYENDAKR